MATKADEHTPLHARYGISTFESFFDLNARRHMMPSVMDWVPLLLQRCACPGARSPDAIQCILPYTNLDHLCDACREHCHGDLNGKTVHFIEGFGPAYHFVVNIAPEPTPPVPPAAPKPPKPERPPAGPVVVDADTPGVILWAPNIRGSRLHAYRQKPGFVPKSLCNQAQDRTWEDVKRRAGTMVDAPVCKSCVRLVNR